MNAALLTVHYNSLSPEERAEALQVAYAAGREAAAGPVDPSDLEAGRPMEYYIHVIAPLNEQGHVGSKSAAGWKLQCLDHRALEDPRVQAFLHGWHVGALEVLRETRELDEARAAELRRMIEEPGG